MLWPEGVIPLKWLSLTVDVLSFATAAFMLPILTVQPIVENAVRHGICKKPGGGTLEIASSPGTGTRAVIRIPREKPEKAV